MTDEAVTALRVTRILVAIHPALADQPTVSTAASMAALLHAELVGLFIEDANLVKLAGLPFVRVVDPLSAQPRTLGTAELERSLRIRLHRAQTVVTRSAEGLRIRSSLQVVRGSYLGAALAAASELDVLLLSQPAPPARGAAQRRTVCTLYDGTPASARAMGMAAELARHQNRPLTVAIAASTGAASPLREAAEALLAGSDLRLRFLTVDADSTALMARLRAEGCGLLVLSREPDTAEHGRTASLLARAACPVVLVP